MASELEIKERLIDAYKLLRRLRRVAEKEEATETIKEIDEELNYIKLKLDPLQLPDV